MSGIQENQMLEFAQSVIVPIGTGKVPKEIPLTQGKVAMVDDEDFPNLICHKWYAHEAYYRKGLFYAVRSVHNPDKQIMMHHAIIGKPKSGMVTDHRDGDGLNNQRHNLRHVSPRINQQNRHAPKMYSAYPGVSRFKNGNWVSQLKINGKSKYLGTFELEKEAYTAYCDAVKELKA